MPTIIDLSTLGSRGFIIRGDSAGDQAGWSVSSAGDVNGDGFADVIVGAPFGDDGGTDAGEAYVIFGKASGFGTVDLTFLAPADGFVIQGTDGSNSSDPGYLTGFSVSSAGDVDGDGFDDMIVGAPDADLAGVAGGVAYIVYGKAGGFGEFDGVRNVVDVNLVDVVIGDAEGDDAGYSVSSAGDVNGDGFDDIIVGARAGDNGGTDAGEAYVIFGKAGGIGAIDVFFSIEDRGTGFVIQGDVAGDQAGFSVSAAGDFNGDGYDDLLVGAPLGDDGGASAGEAYVIYGKASGFGTIDLTNLQTGSFPEVGFVIRGDAEFEQAGGSVSSAGDVNGDGYDDLVIGARFGDGGGSGSGDAYVIFGRAESTRVIDLTLLAPGNGFVIQGGFGDQAGISVSSAGDVNGDGYDDLIVGAAADDEGGFSAGSAYVVFGKAGGFGTIGLSGLAPADGFVIRGDSAGDQAGFSVSAAGDVNNDGFADLIVGAPFGADGGADAGEAYVIFGFGPTESVIRIGSVIAQTIRGGGGDDLLDGRDGDDRLLGADGADQLIGGAGHDALQGGGDDDSLSGGSGNDSLDGGDGDDSLTGAGGNDLLNGGDGFDLIQGGSGDDILDGGDGDDDLRGGSGVNLALYASAAAGVKIDLRLTGPQDTGGAGVDTLVAIQNLAGSAFGDTLGGTTSDNVIEGGGGSDALFGRRGNDTLDGGAGADTMTGGQGDDIYVVDNAGDAVIEAALGGVDTVLSSITYALGFQVDNLTLTGAAAINGIGNGRVNILIGNAAANILNGGAGADTMAGGDGDDTFIVDDEGDRVFEGAGRGNDSVQSSVGFTLGANVENLTLTGSAAIDGTGNNLANTIIGNGGTNVLRGATGEDDLQGGGGADTLFGGNGDDTLSGGGGADEIFGGAGADDLTGGAGLDAFRFDTALDAAANVDDILDYSVADDTIFLDRDIFTGIAANGTLAPGAFRAGTAAADADDRILYDAATGDIYYDSDGTGAAAAILFATVAAGTPLTNADFVGYI